MRILEARPEEPRLVRVPLNKGSAAVCNPAGVVVLWRNFPSATAKMIVVAAHLWKPTAKIDTGFFEKLTVVHGGYLIDRVSTAAFDVFKTAIGTRPVVKESRLVHSLAAHMECFVDAGYEVGLAD